MNNFDLGAAIMFIFYADDYFRYVWKPHGLPSSRGEEECLLDQLLSFDDRGDGLSEYIRRGYELFGREGELGLVNRLDNDTAGLLYFAHTPTIASDYKLLQQQGRVHKYYIADVQGRIDHSMLLAAPIMHHRHLHDRMVVWRGPHDDGKVRGKKHYVETFIEPLVYDSDTNSTLLSVLITQGMRHQIRVHCASLGAPIIGDPLYNKKDASDECLHLWCMGLRIV